MASITTLLQNILSARYGRDVRQSIHDAIKQAYDDGHVTDVSAKADITYVDGVKAELQSEIDEIELDADKVSFDGTESELEADNVQDAIDELKATMGSTSAKMVTYEVWQTMTDEQKNDGTLWGIIGDNEHGITNVADFVLYQNGTVKDALDKLSVEKKATNTTNGLTIKLIERKGFTEIRIDGNLTNAWNTSGGYTSLFRPTATTHISDHWDDDIYVPFIVNPSYSGWFKWDVATNTIQVGYTVLTSGNSGANVPSGQQVHTRLVFAHDK